MFGRRRQITAVTGRLQTDYTGGLFTDFGRRVRESSVPVVDQRVRRITFPPLVSKSSTVTNTGGDSGPFDADVLAEAARSHDVSEAGSSAAVASPPGERRGAPGRGEPGLRVAKTVRVAAPGADARRLLPRRSRPRLGRVRRRARTLGCDARRGPGRSSPNRRRSSGRPSIRRGARPTWSSTDPSPTERRTRDDALIGPTEWRDTLRQINTIVLNSKNEDFR